MNCAQVIVEARGRLWIVSIADIAPPSGALIMVDNCTSRANCEGVGNVVLACSPFRQMAREDRHISYGGPCWFALTFAGSHQERKLHVVLFGET